MDAVSSDDISSGAMEEEFSGAAPSGAPGGGDGSADIDIEKKRAIAEADEAVSNFI